MPLLQTGSRTNALTDPLGDFTAPSGGSLLQSLSNAVTGNPWTLNALLAGPSRPIHIGPNAHMSGNIEDRRGQHMTPEQQAAFISAFTLPDRYTDWQNDEWADKVMNARPADPNYAAERDAVLARQRRLSPPPQSAPAWAEGPPSINLFPGRRSWPAS